MNRAEKRNPTACRGIISGNPKGGDMADQKKESYRELLQRYHVGEQPQAQGCGQLPPRASATTMRFGPGKVDISSVIQPAEDLSNLDNCLVSFLIEDMLDHSLPYIHAVPLFVAARAYGITFKRVSLLCSLYLENPIYRKKDLSEKNLIPDSEKKHIIGKVNAVLDEIFTLTPTTSSEHKENTLRGEIDRAYYKILSAFISKKDLRDFMSLAGERQLVNAEGLPLNMERGENSTELPLLAIFALYKEALEAYSKNHKKRKDDALPDRIIVLLQKIDSGTAADLNLRTIEYRQRPDNDWKKALKDDVPLLQRLFPSLPDLPPLNL